VLVICEYIVYASRFCFFFVHLFHIDNIYFFVLDSEVGPNTNSSRYCTRGMQFNIASHDGCISRLRLEKGSRLVLPSVHFTSYLLGN